MNPEFFMAKSLETDEDDIAHDSDFYFTYVSMIKKNKRI